MASWTRWRRWGSSRERARAADEEAHESLEGRVKVALDLLDRVLADLEPRSQSARRSRDLVTTEEDARFDEAPVLAAPRWPRGAGTKPSRHQESQKP